MTKRKKKIKALEATVAQRTSPPPIVEEGSAKADTTRFAMLLSAMLFVSTLFVYWQVGSHQFINYDDNQYVYDNAHVVSGVTVSNIVWAFTSVDAANWHPVTWISHIVDAQLYGLNPGGHHMTSVIIHALSSALLLVLLYRITGSRWQSAFVAAAFALHPLHVQSVAWVAERKDVLSAFFCFLTLLLYARYVVTRKRTIYLLTIFSFVLGLMAKPMLVMLPVMLLLMDFWPLNRWHSNVHSTAQHSLFKRPSPLLTILKEKIPFFACSILSAAITVYAQHKGETVAGLSLIPIHLRFENSAIAWVTYILQALWPSDLAILYPFPSSIPLWQSIGSVFILIAVSILSILAWRRYPYLAMGWFWFLSTLLPVIGLIQVGIQSRADRYTYIPIIGLFIIAAWGIPAITRNLKYRRPLNALLGGAVILAWATVTWHELGYWRDDVSLFAHAVQVTTNNSVAHNNLGAALAKSGKVEAAIMEFRNAIASDPNFSKPHSNLGIALSRGGKQDEAIAEFRTALAINPNDCETHNNYGIALGKKGDLDGAIKEFRAALDLKPDFMLAERNLITAISRYGVPRDSNLAGVVK